MHFGFFFFEIPPHKIILGFQRLPLPALDDIINAGLCDHTHTCSPHQFPILPHHKRQRIHLVSKVMILLVIVEVGFRILWVQQLKFCASVYTNTCGHLLHLKASFMYQKCGLWASHKLQILMRISSKSYLLSHKYHFVTDVSDENYQE